MIGPDALDAKDSEYSQQCYVCESNTVRELVVLPEDRGLILVCPWCADWLEAEEWLA